ELGQHAYAPVEPAGDRDGGQPASDDDQAYLNWNGDGQAEQMVEPAVDLRHPDAQRRGHPEYRADDGEHVDRMAYGPMDAIADQGIKRRAKPQGQPVAVAEKRQDQPHDGVDGPGVQAPMEEGDA